MRMRIQSVWALALVVFATFLAAGCGRKPAKPRFLWIDALANWETISFPGVIDQIVEKAKEAGFTGLVVDVKPITGEVMYPSRVAPRLTEWKGAVSPGGFDYLDYFVRLAHDRGLTVYASMNVFAGGHRRFERGIAYSEHPEWQCVAYTSEGLVNYSDLPGTEAIFLQPSNRMVQRQNLAVMEEIARHYPVDGIVLDRVYYPDITCDFSETARRSFERFLGHTVENWPEDVFRYQDGRRVPGPLYRQWLLYRSAVLHDFIEDARQTVKQIKPGARFCLYTGAWLPLLLDSGLNWISPESPMLRLWPDTSFARTSVSSFLDGVFLGLFYKELAPGEVPPSVPLHLRGWYAVGSAADSARVALGEGPDIYGGLLLHHFLQEKHRLSTAVSLCLQKLDGVMLFDLVHLEKYNLWKTAASAISRQQ